MSAPGAGHVSCEGFGLTSVPSPLHIVSSPSCGRLSRPLSTMDRSDFPGAIGIPVLRSVMPTSIFLGNPWDLPSSWTVLSWHAILCDPGGIYAGSPLYRPFHTVLFVKLSSHKNIGLRSNYSHKISLIVQNNLRLKSQDFWAGGKRKEDAHGFRPTRLLLLE